LKRQYPDKESSYLSLVAIALFLIDNGCDSTATNERGRSAADELHSTKESVAVIFKVECKRHHMMADIYNTPNAQVKNLFVLDSSTFRDLDQEELDFLEGI
jgi:hypothetical protein